MGASLPQASFLSSRCWTQGQLLFLRPTVLILGPALTRAVAQSWAVCSALEDADQSRLVLLRVFLNLVLVRCWYGFDRSLIDGRDFSPLRSAKASHGLVVVLQASYVIHPLLASSFSSCVSSSYHHPWLSSSYLWTVQQSIHRRFLSYACFDDSSLSFASKRHLFVPKRKSFDLKIVSLAVPNLCCRQSYSFSRYLHILSPGSLSCPAHICS